MKNLLYIILMLTMVLSCQNAFADAVIFSGSDVKALKSNLDLNGGAKVLSASTDPTSSATSATKGSILLNTGGGTAFIKQDAGSSTNWNRLVFGNSSGVVAIAQGGTGQTTANAGFNALSPMTTGGDLIYGGASGVATRLANGSAGQVLISGGGTSAPSWSSAPTLTTPTVQRFTSGSGTYTTPANVKYIIVEVLGGGGGGGSSSSGCAGGNAGGGGGGSSFGTTLLVANGGGGGPTNAGGSCTASTSGTVNAPATTLVNIQGGYGGGDQYNPAATNLGLAGGNGGVSFFGGAGGGRYGGAGSAAIANSGSGGGGGGISSSSASQCAGSGGCAGGYVKALISSPSATYAYTVGAGGTAGSAGVYSGAAGGSGIIIVTEHYH